MDSYSVGIDIGTTFTSAAVHRDGRSTIVELGTRSAAIPSVVLLRADETVVAGETAERRATAEPHRVAREFKRRLGDPTPLLLGGVPYAAEALIARLLRWVVDEVERREGGPAAAVAVTHPANWGPFKIDLLGQAVRRAGLDDVTFLTEPEAAVRHYASQQRVEIGSVVAVYDLGGGTFDTAVLRKVDEETFEILGRPEGIERLGGIDFDAAVLGHVTRVLGAAVAELDRDDPATLQALARLRRECVDAKEALSSDTDAVVPVMLPGTATEVRLTRAEFEAMVRPALGETIDAMRRAMDSADITEEDVSTVLLVGGSSRLPIVAQLVSNELGRPVAVDADPKHAVALGAAGAAAAIVEATDRVPVAAAPPVAPNEPAMVVDREAEAPKRSRVPVLVGAALALVVSLVAGWLVLRGTGEPEQVRAATGRGTTVAAGPAAGAAHVPHRGSTTPSASSSTTRAATADTHAEEPPRNAPDSTVATGQGLAAPRITECPTGPQATACITDLSIDEDGGLVATYVTRGYTPELEPPSEHIHFYFDSVIGDDERNAGTAGSGGDWRLWDGPNPFTAVGGDHGRTGYTLADADTVGATRLCSIVADAHHAAVPGTGNCIELIRP
ncbi:MAG TPA: Hsp70 family protein [Acidimicrobiales bacterium]|nr:Hsp70 family protein [Acidimicrobiales bacterium]